MSHPLLHDLYDYWDRLRGDHLAPARSDIRPNEMKHLLPNIFMAERGNDGEFYFRLGGTNLCDMACKELRGERLLQQFSIEDRHKMQQALSRVAQHGSLISMKTKGKTSMGRALEMSWLILPLRYGDIGFPRLIGVCVPSEKPYWVGRDPIKFQTISSGRMMSANEQLDDEEFAAVYERAQASVRRGRGISALQTHISNQFDRRKWKVPSIKISQVNAAAYSTQKTYRHLTVYEGGRS